MPFTKDAGPKEAERARVDKRNVSSNVLIYVKIFCVICKFYRRKGQAQQRSVPAALLDPLQQILPVLACVPLALADLILDVLRFLRGFAADQKSRGDALL